MEANWMPFIQDVLCVFVGATLSGMGFSLSQYWLQRRHAKRKKSEIYALCQMAANYYEKHNLNNIQELLQRIIVLLHDPSIFKLWHKKQEKVIENLLKYFGTGLNNTDTDGFIDTLSSIKNILQIQNKCKQRGPHSVYSRKNAPLGSYDQP